ELLLVQDAEHIALVLGHVGGAVPKLGSPEQAVTELRVPALRRRRLVRSAIRTAGPDGGSGQSNAYASTSDR
ncbi:hypothetical protein ABZ688_16500, partial [Streptomyces fimicarius]